MADTPGLLLVHGDEPHLIDQSVARWRADAGPGSDIEVIDAPARPDALIASLVDMPLFASARHVLVRDLPQLTGARRPGGGAEEIVRALGMRAPSTMVCFAVRATVAPTNVVLAAITASGGTVVHHPALRAGDRRQWLDREVHARSLRLPAGAADMLLRCTGGDLGAIDGELDKISAFGPLDLDEFQQLLAGTEQLQLYNVLDLLASAQPARGAALLGRLVDEGRSTQHLLSILSGQLRDLLMAHALLVRGQRGANALAAAARIPAWRAERVQRQAAAIPAGLALRWMRELQRIDAGLKAGEIDDAAALRQWGLRAAAALREHRGTRRSA